MKTTLVVNSGQFQASLQEAVYAHCNGQSQSESGDDRGVFSFCSIEIKDLAEFGAVLDCKSPAETPIPIHWEPGVGFLWKKLVKSL
jgi:hypothetical protein